MVGDASLLMLLISVVFLAVFTFGFLLSKPKLTGANKEILKWLERSACFILGMSVMSMLSRGLLWECILIVNVAFVPWTKMMGRISSMFQRVFGRPRASE